MAEKHSQYASSFLPLLTLEEKIALVSGHDFMFTNPIPRLGIPSIRMSDGAHGLRVQNPGDSGVVGSSMATCFPTSATSANSFDPQLLLAMGQAIASECCHYGIDILLGPGVNIKRNPLCGRNFEYFSEDPLLSGRLGEAEIEGLQSMGIGSTVKHFALNNEENHRFMGDSIADRRAMREIYLKPFEYIVKSAHPQAIMNAYNKINGVYCTESSFLLTDILRKQWGYQGLVMTDWGATHDRIAGLASGNDLEMPGDTPICRKWIYDGVNSASLPIEALDEAALNVLDLVGKHLQKPTPSPVDWISHHELAKSIAEESAVLLKNDGTLPLNCEESLCVIGSLFENMRYQGSGSSMIQSAMLTTPKDAFDAHGIRYCYAPGYGDGEGDSLSLLANAIEMAKPYERVLLFLGLTDSQESEGGDRPDMKLNKDQLDLVEALLKEKKRIAVVLFGGAVVELPFFDGIDCLLHMFLPGQNGGEACFDLLFGESCPCGKLAESWPLRYEDVPFGEEFGKSALSIYKESIYVGYRYYLSAHKPLRFPFGYGLSYTEFAYEDMEISEEGDDILIDVEVKNVGKRQGKEIVQAYVALPSSNFHRPIRELKGFAKVALSPQESKKVRIAIKKEDLAVYDVEQDRFILEEGEYRFEIGKSAAQIVLAKTLPIDGERISKKETPQNPYENLDFANLTNEVFAAYHGIAIPALPPAKPIRLESRFDCLKQSFLGRILFKAVMSVPGKDKKKAKKMAPGKDRDNAIKGALALEKMLESNSLVTMTMSAGESFPYNFAEAFMHLANGHLLQGIKSFLKKIKAPALPKKEGG